MTGAGSGSQGSSDAADAEEAERCPICLGVLAGSDLAIPDSCCHVFCLRCLLTWAEMSPSCPVDRKPFHNVYRWDGNLRCLQVPLKKHRIQPESKSCCCRNPEQKACLQKEPIRRPRRQKVERTVEAKSKGLVRKCNDEDQSSLSRKKVRGAECSWSPPPCVSLSAAAEDVVDPVWVSRDLTYDTLFKPCKPQVLHAPWLSPAAPITASGTSGLNFPETTWNHSPPSFTLVSSPFISTSSIAPSHFAFQGVVCAITCAKGGEKRGGRRSTSKASTKDPAPLPARRSGRHSKSQEEASTSDNASPPQAGVSDSDSSTSQSAKLGKTSQVPARRKGKQPTNRKANGKRKAAPKKKKSPEVVNSPVASDEEEEEEPEEKDNDRTDKEEETTDLEEQEVDNTQQPSNLESSPTESHEGLNCADAQGWADTSTPEVEQELTEEEEEFNYFNKEEKVDESDEDITCPPDSTLSPGLSPDVAPSKNEEEEEEEASSPMSLEEKDEERNTTVCSSEEEQPSQKNDNILVCGVSEDNCNQEMTKELAAETCQDLIIPDCSATIKSTPNVAELESKASVEVKDIPQSEELSEVELAVDGTDEYSTSKDDTSIIPMDCGSPLSEHGESPNLEFEIKNDYPTLPDTQASASEKKTTNNECVKQELERSEEERRNKQRRSRFHSPTSTWSPKRESRREQSRRSRSRSRERNSSPPSSRTARARSRDRERDGDRDHSRRDRSRERRRRRSRSRSRSRSRTRLHRRGPSPERPASRERSPPKERRGGWRPVEEGRKFPGGTGRFENGGPNENSPDQGWSENPDWVTEKTRGDAESRNRDSGGGPRWEEHRSSGGNRAEPQGRGARGGFDRGWGAARGAAGGNRSFYNQQEDSTDNRWQPRNNFSGTGNNSGNDSYSRFNENRGGGRRKEPEPGELDRSGWSSASSWAVRRKLPADVQDYYSKRERGGPGSWNRQEEEQQAAATDPPPQSEAPVLAVPGNAPVPVMNVIPPHPPQLSVLHHFPMQAPQGALPISLQPAAAFAMPPPVPLHLHPAVPLLQVPAVGAQGLPPPPPPPPPVQQGSQTLLSPSAAPANSQTTQMASAMACFAKPGLLQTPTKAVNAAAVSAAPSQVLPSSTTQPWQHSKAQPDSSKKEKKQQIQEKAINEVKTAIKPFYQKKEITKEEYKEIVRKAVEKVCHSKSGEVNSSKVANLVKAYVDKYKHARKK
ncbi:protein SCAF11 isoform X2 [Gouania willdenowi]|uniref:protein SCAF11 isoform X2 n=1 Tax=Gouania willdenowi TaxID=441366 RepID=UPI0010550844|nr:protein SCAF11 isoform X2 [Gouania willdenowi]